jgi:hypothetical protein
MPDWRDDYLASLQEAERNNPINKDLVEACKCTFTFSRIVSFDSKHLKQMTPSTNKHPSIHQTAPLKMKTATTFS